MTDLTPCIEFLRSFNGAHDDWADEIEHMQKVMGAVELLVNGDGHVLLSTKGAKMRLENLVLIFIRAE